MRPVLVRTPTRVRATSPAACRRGPASFVRSDRATGLPRWKGCPVSSEPDVEYDSLAYVQDSEMHRDKISAKIVAAGYVRVYRWLVAVRGSKQQELFGPRGGVRVRNGHAPKKRRKRRIPRAFVAAKPGRRGPGRPRKGVRAGSPHTARPELKGRFPVHVVLRVVDDIGSLRKRFMYHALREATIAVALRELRESEGGAFRIVHISIQRNHVHLIVEAEHKMALSRGMQSFQISAAKHLNRAISVKRALAVRRRGTVFPDRFHQEIITTPKQARHTLAYVLNNWRKHREDQGVVQRRWNVDPFSSAALFDGWKVLEDSPVMWRLPIGYEAMTVYLPKTWLLRVGWKMHGLLDTHEVPSARRLDVARAPGALRS